MGPQAWQRDPRDHKGHHGWQRDPRDKSRTLGTREDTKGGRGTPGMDEVTPGVAEGPWGARGSPLCTGADGCPLPQGCAGPGQRPR